MVSLNVARRALSIPHIGEGLGGQDNDFEIYCPDPLSGLSGRTIRTVIFEVTVRTFMSKGRGSTMVFLNVSRRALSIPHLGEAFGGPNSDFEIFGVRTARAPEA